MLFSSGEDEKQNKADEEVQISVKYFRKTDCVSSFISSLEQIILLFCFVLSQWKPKIDPQNTNKNNSVRQAAKHTVLKFKILFFFLSCRFSGCNVEYCETL